MKKVENIKTQTTFSELKDAIIQIDEVKFISLLPSFRSRTFLGGSVVLACLFGWEKVLEKVLSDFYDAEPSTALLNMNDDFLKIVLNITRGELPIMITKEECLIQLGMYYCVCLGRVECLRTISKFYELRLIDLNGRGLIEIAYQNLNGSVRDEMIKLLISEFDSDEKGNRVYFLARSMLENDYIEIFEQIIHKKVMFEKLSSNQSKLCLLTEFAIHKAIISTLSTMMKRISDQRYCSVHSLLNEAFVRGNVDLIKNIMDIFGPYRGLCYNPELE